MASTGRQYFHGDVIEGHPDLWFCSHCDAVHAGQRDAGGSDLDRLRIQVEKWRGPFMGLALHGKGAPQMLDRPTGSANIFGDGARGSGRRGKSKRTPDYACARDKLTHVDVPI